MRKYMVREGYDDGMSRMNESLFDGFEEARRAFDEADPRREWRTEWECLPVGGRNRLKGLRMAKELWEVDADTCELVGVPIDRMSYGYDEFITES